ncbi:hypothetical protein [Deinococcus aquatilis]|uniref:hypothetical protein n=1 Tax=Deinococcus aquatilis TaxID=519440 RepID=UPI00036DCA24|nr:hypothetical protein [Deinococcus aquatilis]
MAILPKVLTDFWRYRGSILGTATSADPTKAMPVSSSNPLPVTLVGATTITSNQTITVAGQEATSVQTRQVLSVGAAEVGLTIPANANRALVTVTAGVAQMGFGDAPTAPEYAVKEGLQLSGAQLPALRLIRSGSSNATVRIDYWREGA